MKRVYLFYICCCVCMTACFSQSMPLPSANRSQLQPGDLLFVVTPEGNAITDVTQGYRQSRIDHVAIYHKEGCCETACVIEAIPDSGVCVHPLDSLLRRCQTSDGRCPILVGRVTGDVDVEQSLSNALSLVGKPYDTLFLPDYMAIYCSELIQKSYVDHAGKLVFDPIPMSFHDSSGRITEYWTAHYRQHGMDVPEGLAGTNPGELSRRDNVRMMFLLE